MFLVLQQISFIRNPLFSQLIKICKIKRSIQWSRLIIIYFSFSIKLIILPFALISYLAIRIKQPSKTMHLIFRPLPIINTSLLEYHHTVTTLFPIFYSTFIRSFTCKIFKGFEARSTSTLVIMFTYLFNGWKDMLCFRFHWSLRTWFGGFFNWEKVLLLWLGILNWRVTLYCFTRLLRIKR